MSSISCKQNPFKFPGSVRSRRYIGSLYGHLCFLIPWILPILRQHLCRPVMTRVPWVLGHRLWMERPFSGRDSQSMQLVPVPSGFWFLFFFLLCLLLKSSVDVFPVGNIMHTRIESWTHMRFQGGIVIIWICAAFSSFLMLMEMSLVIHLCIVWWEL